MPWRALRPTALPQGALHVRQVALPACCRAPRVRVPHRRLARGVGRGLCLPCCVPAALLNSIRRESFQLGF